MMHIAKSLTFFTAFYMFANTVTATNLQPSEEATNKFMLLMQNEEVGMDHIQNNFYSLAMQKPLAYGRGRFSTIIDTPYLVAALNTLKDESTLSLDKSEYALRIMYLISLDPYRDERFNTLGTTIMEVMNKIRQGDKKGIITKRFFNEIEELGLKTGHIKEFIQMVLRNSQNDHTTFKVRSNNHNRLL